VNLLASELLKLRTTRMVYALLGALLLIVALFTVLGIFTTQKAELARESDQSGFWSSASTGIIFVLLLGVMLIAGEYRHGTITQTFLITPVRWRVLAAKLVAGAVLGFAFGLIAELFTMLLVVPLMNIRGVDVIFGHRAWSLMLGTILVTTLCGALGVAVASVIRNQVAAIITVFAGLLIVEPILGHALGIKWPELPKYLPGHAIGGVIGDDEGGLTRQWSALVLLGYIGVLSLIGERAFLSRDVNSIQS